MAIHIKSGGVWKALNTTYIKYSNAWVKPNTVWINQGGTWKIAWKGIFVYVQSTTVSNGFAVRDRMIAAGWDGNSPVECYINAEVSRDGAHDWALHCWGSFPNGLLLVNNSQIIGHGGRGGNGGTGAPDASTAGGNGSAGGRAVSFPDAAWQAANNVAYIHVQNNGGFYGGGGGGSGSGGASSLYANTYGGTGAMGGAGGGGGAGGTGNSGGGWGGSASGMNVIWWGNNGTGGTRSGPGTGGAQRQGTADSGTGTVGTRSGTGGNGAWWGGTGARAANSVAWHKGAVYQDGAREPNGSAEAQPSGWGGAGGASTLNAAAVTWLATGIRSGPIQ